MSDFYTLPDSPMTDDSQRHAAVSAATTVKAHLACLLDIQQFTPEIMNHFRRGGIRSGAGRTNAEMQQLLDKIPPSHRVGADGKSAALKVKEYLSNQDASHIQPYSKGGSSHPNNIKWESRKPNRVRGDQPMTQQEQVRLEVKAQFDNLTGAVKAGVGAAPRGAVIGAVTTVPFSLLRNSLRVIRGEVSASVAARETVKETATGSAIGAVSAFTITTLAMACPPIAIGLGAISPALLVVGGVGMIHEFFKTLEDHQTQVQTYYASLTQAQLHHLEQVENELNYEHSQTIAVLAHAQATRVEILNRPREAGIEGALKRYRETAQIKASVSAPASTTKLTQDFEQILLPRADQP